MFLFVFFNIKYTFYDENTIFLSLFPNFLSKISINNRYYLDFINYLFNFKKTLHVIYNKNDLARAKVGRCPVCS